MTTPSRPYAIVERAPDAAYGWDRVLAVRYAIGDMRERATRMRHEGRAVRIVLLVRPGEIVRTSHLPTIHLNGTDRDTLVQLQLDALSYLRDGRDKVQAAYPNGRDYYPQGDGAYARARAVWNDRLSAIDDVIEALEAEAAALSDL